MEPKQEWNGRHQSGMESRLKQARLPWVKPLAQFDFSFQPDIDRKVVLELAGPAFVEQCENVILLGYPSGEKPTGCSPRCESGGCGSYIPLDRLIATLMKAKLENLSA